METNTHRCPACNEDKPLSQFYGGSGRCKPCKSLYYKALRASRERSSGWRIYAVQEGDVGPIKIGRTRGRVGVRFSSLQSGNSRELCLLGWTRAGEADEDAVHDALASFQIRDGWFRNVPEVRSYIRGLLSTLRREPCYD